MNTRGRNMSGTVVAYIPDSTDLQGGGPWACHCQAVWSPTPLISWRCGDEYHSASICWDYGEILLPPGGHN